MTDDATNARWRTGDAGQIDDIELLRRYVAEQSQTAFGELVRRHIDFVYASALRQTRGNAALAQDVTQAVFTDLARKAGGLAQHEAFVGWLHTATRFAAGKAIRTEVRRQVREHEAHVMNETLREADEPVDWTRLHPVLDDVLGELKERERAAVLLRFFERRPLAEVGAKLALTESAARSCVDRALEKMRALLAKRGVASTGAALAVALANQVSVAAPAGLAASVTGTALASAAAASGSALATAKILTFMSTIKIVSGVAGAVVLLAVGAAVLQSNLARENAAALAAVSAERDALRARVGFAEKQVAESAVRVTSVLKELGDARASAKPPEAAATRAPSQGAAMDYVLEHPETHGTFVQQQELRVKTRYERFLKNSGLSAAVQETVVNELKGALADELDFMGALRAQGLGVGNMPQDPEERARLEGMIREKKQASQARLRAALGEDAFRQFAQYSALIPERNVAEQVAGRLYDTTEPLTTQQANQLTQILAQNRLSPQSTMNGAAVAPQAMGNRVAQVMQQQGMNMLDWAAPVSDAAIAKLQGVLSPAQLAAVTQLQAQQFTQIQLAPPAPAAGPANARK